MKLSATIRGASIWGPGLEGWAASLPVLAGDAAYVACPFTPPTPALLPPAERRRAGPVIRLALAAAHEAVARAGLDPAELDAVFASSNGDGPVVTAILDTLATQTGPRVVSPTQFHNSVHNATAGYWSIATASRRPASCIGAHDESWAAGLLTALAGLRATGAPVLLCCYDHPLPPPLAAIRPTGPAFAAAAVLTTGESPNLHVTYDPQTPCAGAISGSAYGDLRLNPAARALPLLEALAANRAGTHEIAYGDGRLVIEFAP